MSNATTTPKPNEEESLAMFRDASANEEAHKQAEDALLTALSGGYELSKRIEVVRVLIGNTDVSLHSLLAKHLVAIRDEAVETGEKEIAKDAERLLKRLTPSDE